MAGEKRLHVFIMWLLLPAGLLTRPLVGTVKTCDSGGEDEKRCRSECCMALFSNGARGVHGGWERSPLLSLALIPVVAVCTHSQCGLCAELLVLFPHTLGR